MLNDILFNIGGILACVVAVIGFICLLVWATDIEGEYSDNPPCDIQH